MTEKHQCWSYQEGTAPWCNKEAPWCKEIKSKLKGTENKIKSLECKEQGGNQNSDFVREPQTTREATGLLQVGFSCLKCCSLGEKWLERASVENDLVVLVNKHEHRGAQVAKKSSGTWAVSAMGWHRNRAVTIPEATPCVLYPVLGYSIQERY